MRRLDVRSGTEALATDQVFEPLLAAMHEGLVRVYRLKAEGASYREVRRARFDWDDEHGQDFAGERVLITPTERSVPYSAEGGRVVVNQGFSSEGASFEGHIAGVSLKGMGGIALNDGVFSNGRKTENAEFVRASVNDIFRLTETDVDLITLQSFAPAVVLSAPTDSLVTS